MRRSPRRCGCARLASGSVTDPAADASGVTWTSSTERSRLHRVFAVQLEIELQHVDHRLADEAERSTVLAVANRVAHLVSADAARMGHAGHLDSGVRRRDVGVKAASAGGDGV